MSLLHAFATLFGMVAEDINLLTVRLASLFRNAAIRNDLLLRTS